MYRNQVKNLILDPSFIGWPQSKRNKYTYIHGKHFQQSPSMKHTRIIIIEKENGKFSIKKSSIGHRYSIEIYIHKSVSDDLDIKRIGSVFSTNYNIEKHLTFLSVTVYVCKLARLQTKSFFIFYFIDSC